ncbi:unnamed protein product [Linum tenue]|uniref:RNase H type-1 domain-containing protein n=1 Tax=Linum tenue TaxID=586396 RepID=A0AAV0LGN2_9ROSI|nr:unnamed protein product [Linum tenue]
MIRDHTACCVAAFASNLGICSITRAELRGAVEGFQLAFDRGYHRVHVELDSKCAVQLLHSPNRDHIMLLLYILIDSRSYFLETGKSRVTIFIERATRVPTILLVEGIASRWVFTLFMFLTLVYTTFSCMTVKAFPNFIVL